MTIVFYILGLEDQFSATNDAVVHLDTVPLDVANVIALVSEVSSCDYSDYLDISSAWKSLVASCVCVAEARKLIFNMFVSSTKVFISSMKCVRLQCQRWSSIALETRVESAIIL